METKMSNRDKLLLIVLGIIIVIFGAIMLPTYGIKDLIVSINDTKSKISSQTSENEETLAGLVAQGVSAGYAENFAQAKRRLSQEILTDKYDIVKQQETSLTGTAYAVADDWLRPVKYLHFDEGNTELYASVAITRNSGGFTGTQIVYDDNVYDIDNYSCLFSCNSSATERYDMNLEYVAEGTGVDSISMLIAVYNVLSERGSVTINNWLFDENGITLDLVLSVPFESKIADYAAEIGECHHCGKPYYLSDYYSRLADLPEGETEVRCTNPDCNPEGDPAVLTGEALR